MLKLAIDFGSATTKIYRLGSGVVLSEPTCVAVLKETGEIRAYGSEAKKLLGKTSDQTEVVFPLYEGQIVNEKLAGALLEYFLSKVVKRTFGTEALFCVSCGCPAEDREKYYRVAKAAGLNRISFAESPFLAALGEDVPLSESNPVFCVDVGAGQTSVAAFSLEGIIAGLSMSVGGRNMDVHIIDHVAENFNLKIGTLSAEKLKTTVGSLIERDNQSMIVNGRDVITGKPRSVSLSSENVLFPIRVYVDKILEYTELVLRKLPAEVSAAVCKNGIFLSGGTAGLAGFADYVAERLQMETHLARDPQMAVVLGGGRALGDAALLRRIRME